MFSPVEKSKIAAVIEKALLDLNHPEMPKENPSFHIHVKGKESWSWADIEPNWVRQYEMNSNIRKKTFSKDKARKIWGR